MWCTSNREVMRDVIVEARRRRQQCDCSRHPGQDVCTRAGREEIKTVQVPRSTGVALSVTSGDGPIINFGRLSGGQEPVPGASAPGAFEVSVTGTAARPIAYYVNLAGRPSVCSPDASISGVPPC